MKETPILFSGDMVRAILDGRKTQTRRIITPQPQGQIFNKYGTWNSASFPGEWACRYGDTVSRLWVRETFCPQMNMFGQAFPDRTPFYRADEESLPILHKWKPSIFMPRWACRILLDVVSVRVERLQDISEEDAIAEGVWTASPDMMASQVTKNHIGAYRQLWDSINKKRGFGWDANPFCWVISFRRIA